MMDFTGKIFGSYRLHKLIGSGGYADVYEAVHVVLRRRAAIKVLRVRVNPQDIQAVRKSLNEALVVNKLKHPHIIPILDCNIQYGFPYIVMPYIKNGSLRQIYGEGARLSWNSMIDYVRQIAETLTFVHSHNLVHQDVKPENMLLGDNGCILLCDFGTVSFIQYTGVHASQECVGTVGYMAPERFTGDLQTPATDVYSLGVVVYSWLTGRLPFTGSASEVVLKHLHAPPPIQPLQALGIDPAVQRVLLKALAKNPRKRFQSAMEFYKALRNAKRSSIQRQCIQQGHRTHPGRSLFRWEEMSCIVATGMLLSFLLAAAFYICGVELRTDLTISLICLSLFLLGGVSIRKNWLALQVIFTNYTVAIMIGILAQSLASFCLALPILLLISAFIGFFKGCYI